MNNLVRECNCTCGHRWESPVTKSITVAKCPACGGEGVMTGPVYEAGGFRPSQLQQAIFDWVSGGTGSAIVDAVAGSGKTTTIVKALELIPNGKKVAFLAFNKSIATELAERVPSFVQAMTLNSAGYRAYRGLVLGGSKGFIKVEARKTQQLAMDIIYEDVRRYSEDIIKLVGLAKSFGIVPNYIRSAAGIMPDDMESWYWLVDRFDIDIPSGMMNAAVDTVREILAAGLREKRIIDYNDQLYMPVVYGASFDRYDWLFVDEAQDVSPIQRAMLRLMLKPGGRLVAVGDPCQAIYGFRGSDSESLKNIAQDFNAIRLPLSISYRCPQNVVAYAQRYVDHIEASATAPEGGVKSLTVFDGTEFGPEDMVICRNTAPLIQLAYALIPKRVPFKVMGRDVGSGLVKLIERLKPKGVRGENGLLAKLEAWKEREINKLLRDGKEDRITTVEDKYDSLMAFIDGSGADTVPKIKESIESMFSDRKQGDKFAVLTLCTIHKSKGLEAGRVFVLNDYLMPSKWARQEWRQEQERNIQYVAYTRAQKELIFIDLDRMGAAADGKQRVAVA